MTKRLRPEEKRKPGPRPGEPRNITAEGRERMATSKVNPIAKVLYDEYLTGVKPTELSLKYNMSRNSVLGHLWRERRGRQGLVRSPWHTKVKVTVIEQPQRRDIVSLPIVRWIEHC